MPITTNLGVSPYFDDYDQTKEYYKVLFKPSVAVQTRELNQLQTILQNQIERFGNNIYKRGTIINGCNFIFYDNYPYAKLEDSEIDGIPANPVSYVNNFVRNTTGLVGYVLNSANGYVATNPDLNTIFIRYVNSGQTGNSTTFSPGDTLTVYNGNNSLSKTYVAAGGAGFSNTDTLVFVPALSVNAVSATPFQTGETIIGGTTSARASVISVDTTSLLNSTVIRIKPLQSDVTNSSLTATTWTFSNNETITGQTSGATAVVNQILGSGASGSIQTDVNGVITGISLSSGGGNYLAQPYVTVKQAVPVATYPSTPTDWLNVYNYLGKIRVANNSLANSWPNTNPVGVGYAFGVTEGIVYKNGYFLRVDPQTTVVTKYTNVPNNVSIGFATQESIIDYNIDSSLLDNATGTFNQSAPGADRLQITPYLITLDSATAAANADFLSIVEFSEGYPYRQNQETQYNAIEDEMARRTNDASGNFSIDRFQVTTRSPTDYTREGNTFSVIVDPGSAYISGYKVQTLDNYAVDDRKGNDYITSNSEVLQLSYSSYVTVKNLAGAFAFNTGATVQLYDTARSFTSNSSLLGLSGGTITPVGNLIGTANIRQVVQQGSGVYQLYLFNVNMNTGANFSSIRSIVYNNGTSNVGIADVVTTFSTSQNSSIATLSTSNSGPSQLIFPTGSSSLLYAQNLSYQYTTVNSAFSITNSGSFSLTTPDVFPYSGTLTAGQLNDIVLIPTSSGLTVNSSLTGTVLSNSSSNVLVGTATTFNDTYLGLVAGDYILIANSTANCVRIVTQVTNSTSITLDSAPTFNYATATVTRYFPQNVPFPLTSTALRDSYVVTASGSTLNFNLNLGFTQASTTCSIYYKAQRNGVAPEAKQASRGNYVYINLANNAGGINGPWCLGVPDIFRLQNVFLGSSNSVSESDIDVTSNFFIDHNQNSDYYDLGFLYKKTLAGLSLSSSNWLLVKFDSYSVGVGAGPYTVTSYVSSNSSQRATIDSLPRSSLGSNSNTLEIPEIYTHKGSYYDLIDCIDFRPIAANTANVTNSLALATVNPPYTTSFSSSVDRHFPVPGSSITYDKAYFLGRQDAVAIGSDNNITLIQGKPIVGKIKPSLTIPNNTMVINVINVPPYPNIPFMRSSTYNDIIATNIANERFSFQRVQNHSLTNIYSSTDIDTAQPQRYTMSNIGDLERRIQALEYYVSLSLLEASIKDLNIPSSISAGINRFKFGFFTDNFNDTSYTDLLNPEYSASISNNYVIPKENSTVVITPPSFPPYTEYALVSQPLATSTNSTAVLPVTYNGVVTNVSPTTIEVHRYEHLSSGVKTLWYGQQVTANIAGLKPLTAHRVFLNGTELTNTAIQYSTNTLPSNTTIKLYNQSLLTDASGKLNLTVYISINQAALVDNDSRKNIVLDPGSQKVIIYNSDNSSSAFFNLPSIVQGSDIQGSSKPGVSTIGLNFGGGGGGGNIGGLGDDSGGDSSSTNNNGGGGGGNQVNAGGLGDTPGGTSSFA